MLPARRGPHQRGPGWCCLLSVEPTITSLRNLFCGCLPIGRVTYRGEVFFCYALNLRQPACCTHSFREPSFRQCTIRSPESIPFADAPTMHTPVIASQQLSSAAPLRSRATARFWPSTHDRSLHCAESPGRNR